MPEIRISNPESLGKPLGPYSHVRLREFPKMFANGVYPPNTLLVVDRLVQEQFLVEVQTIAAL